MMRQCRKGTPSEHWVSSEGEAFSETIEAGSHRSRGMT
jgi:hypothetical protein